MLIPHATTIAVADGETLLLFRNHGNEAAPELLPHPHPDFVGIGNNAGQRHHSSAANPSDGQLREDGFAAATAAWLNKATLGGEIETLVIIAPPRTLGELRQHYHKALEAKLIGEIAKELTGHSVADILKSIAAA